MHCGLKKSVSSSLSRGFINWLLLLGVSGGVLGGGLLALLGPDWFGAGRYNMHDIPPGDLMPMPFESDFMASHPKDPTREGQAALRHWSKSPLPSWPDKAKVTAPRILLAKLATNTDIAAVNAYLLEARPWSGVGSNWTLHYGDYDFSLVTLTTLLYISDEYPGRLYPETRQHLLEVLLTEEGSHPLITVPRTQGYVLDTENHILMTEGSRYLKNQWLATHGTDEQRINRKYDNQSNGLEDFLHEFLAEMAREGVYEFNSRPYIGYTLQALLNIEAFPASARLRNQARYLLDKINLQYALGSMQFRRNPPFRRQYKRADDSDLDGDPHASYMRIWCDWASVVKVPNDFPSRYSGNALLAELMPYGLPDAVRQWTLHKRESYFVLFGRGRTACPEIYSGGPGYLFSAGGANRGFRSHIVTRPITLLLDDGKTDIKDCFHITGKGNWRRWNMTGVHHRFACADGPVHVPESLLPTAEAAGWRIFSINHSHPLKLAVYSEKKLGIMALFMDEDISPETVLEKIRENNPGAAQLEKQFIWPDGCVLEYDVHAPIGKWVMTACNGETLDRDYDSWAQMEGTVPNIAFSRSKGK